MPTYTEMGGNGVPAFLAKLWRLVDDPDTNDLICWSKDGRSFIIQNQARFAHDLLPLNYKHNNMASFIRQLNMYGFHKITSIENGGLKFDRDEMEFSHPCFKRNCAYLLEHIKRKIANTPKVNDSEKCALKPEAVTKVLQDVKAMRGKQESLDSRFSVMKQENEALWREIASLRQKHAKQQQIVNKLIQFLITIVQPSRNMTSVRRHMQLMINDTPGYARMHTTSDSEAGDCGPVIQELGEVLDEVGIVSDEDDDVDELIDPNSPYANLRSAHASPSQPRPQSCNSHASGGLHFDYDTNQSADDDAVDSAFATAARTAGFDISSVYGGGDGSVRSPIIQSPRTIPSESPRPVPSQSPASIIQSINADGSRIVYHVTELPDVSEVAYVENVGPTADATATAAEENVLTPLVREQMVRTQQLKRKNKERRSKSAKLTTALKTAKMSRGCKLATASSSLVEPLKIKAECEVDPMMFLMSPSFNEDSHQSSDSNVIAGVGDALNATSTVDTNASGVAADTLVADEAELFETEEFLNEEIPADLFQDSCLLAADNISYNNNKNHSSSNDGCNAADDIQNLQQEQLQLQLQQQQYGRSTPSGGNFSANFAGNAIGCAGSGPSTSAAAAGSVGGKTSDDNMAMTKYKNASSASLIDDTSRLSTADDLHGHLDNIQDEIESLKNMLRGDNYSFDANMLMNGGSSTTLGKTNTSPRLYLPQNLDADLFNKLFNENDLLDPYGLSMDNANDKRGSELMAYQPFYDLSDIIGMENDKNDMNANNADGPSSSLQMSPQLPRRLSSTSNTNNGRDSVLNTPCHQCQ